MPVPVQADSDDKLVQLWLHGRCQRTRDSYSRAVERFTNTIRKPVRMVTVGDLQEFADTLDHLKPRSRNAVLSAIRSLFAFAMKLGYIHVNPAAVLRLEKPKDELASKIRSEGEVQRMIALEPDQRNRVLLRLMYIGGLRVSEVCGLRADDLQERDNGQGQIVVFGKGSKTRTVLLPAALWRELQGGLKGNDGLLFRSRKGGPLSAVQAWRIVKAAAERIGVEATPHTLRHCHASHALDRGGKVHVVRDTLGHSSLATTSIYSHARPGESSAMYLVA